MRNEQRKSIPKEITEHPYFRECILRMFSQTKWRQRTPFSKQILLHEIFWEASRLTIDRTRCCGDLALFHKRNTLTAISRAVGDNDVRSAQCLCAASGLARDHIVVANEKVRLVQPVLFGQEIDRAYDRHLRDMLIKVDAMKKKPKNLVKQIHRQLPLWQVTEKKVIISKVRCRALGGADVNKAQAIFGGMRDSFALHPINEDTIAAQNTFIEKFAQPFGFHVSLEPRPSDYLFAIKKARKCAPGPDGIGYEAYKAVPMKLLICCMRLISR